MSSTTSATTRTATVVVADDRPLVRAGLRALLAGATGMELVGESRLQGLVEVVGRELPSVLVTVVRENDPDPFRVVATVKALHTELRVLAVADVASVVDLREAVISGVDSFLLTDASEEDVRNAVTATARGERVVSPGVAMQLAGPWRDTGEDRPSALTTRELEVLQLLTEGLTNQEIGARLDVSSRTVKTHVQNLLSKLDVPDRTGAVARGFRLGLVR